MTYIAQPSIAWEAVEAALTDWAKDVTSLETVWSAEDGPQPDMPYVEFDWLVPPSGVGDDYYVDTVNEDDKLERELTGVRRAVLTVKVKSASTRPGSNAMYFVDLLTVSLNDEEVVAKYFAAVRSAPWDWADISPGDFAQDKVAVSRAGIDLTIGFSAGIGQPSSVIDYIKGVAITGTISNGTSELVDSIEVDDEEA